MNDMTHRAPVDLPQLRTLLLTDLCDSTELVERLGDVSAAALFREHDRLVLELQQRWRGRLIDRSDGLLLLFERPIDGLGFALDYVRGLRTLGEKRSVELKARAGLHVGEVLTWRNSTEAVQVGAKPLEVEGLAKPMAARLMAVARPGQILLSAVAEPLAHRAARELGERGQHLLWKSHGRWRFKGVPDSQQIYEVGEPGIAPLRMPPNSPKAWRDIPLWRRPAALAAEVALIGVIGVGVWFATRPAPAIAFNQRDWVVVADLRNLTGQAVLDDSLEQAFRISLEQSRYVNVLSDLKARDTLARMRKPADTVLDRSVASEIALRDGARAVILPTVSEVGGKVRVSAEVIDPHSQSTIYAESAEGDGLGSSLSSIDKLTASLRGQLGEAVESIEADSVPLPKATTSNLDALRAYALAQKAYAHGDNNKASSLYEQAVELDPEFALAWIGQVRVKYTSMDAPAALPALRTAEALRAKLATREQMYLDAWVAEFDKPSAALSRWQKLADLYPDYWPAYYNIAIGLYGQNRFAEALPYAKRATSPQYELANRGFDAVGRVNLALGDYASAEKAFDQALAGGYQASRRRLAAVNAAERDFSGAARELARLPPEGLHSYLERISLSLDQSQWGKAVDLSNKALALAQERGGFDSRMFFMPAAVSSWMAGDRKTSLVHARAAADQALTALSKPYNADAVDDATLALSAGLFAVRIGEPAIAKNVVSKLEARKDLMSISAIAELVEVSRAEQLRIGGKPQEAIQRLEPLLSGRERFQTRVALEAAYSAAGNKERAFEQAQWLAKRRGMAYIELECGHCQQALNVVESNRAQQRIADLRAVAGRG